MWISALYFWVECFEMSSIYSLEYIRSVTQLLPHASRSFLGKFSWSFRCFFLTVEVMSFPRVRFALYGSHGLRWGERGVEFRLVLLYPSASTETGYSRLRMILLKYGGTPSCWKMSSLPSGCVTYPNEHYCSFVPWIKVQISLLLS